MSKGIYRYVIRALSRGGYFKENLLSYVGTSLADSSRGERKHSCHFAVF